LARIVVAELIFRYPGFKGHDQRENNVAPGLGLDEAQRTALTAHGIAIHHGDIIEVHHTAGKVEAVTLNTGERVPVETLWWRPDEAPQPPTVKLIAHFGLELIEPMLLLDPAAAERFAAAIAALEPIT
jgi:hypothetical protein